MLHSKARGARQQQLAGCEERRHIMREMISPQLIFITTHTTRAHDQRIRKDGRGRRDERLMFANETHRRETTRRQGIGAKKKEKRKEKKPNIISHLSLQSDTCEIGPFLPDGQRDQTKPRGTVTCPRVLPSPA